MTMVLKRMSNIRRSYRFSRNSSVVEESPHETMDVSTPEEEDDSDVIFNTEGVKVGWMLEQRSPNNNLLMPASLPCSPCIHATYPHYWTIGRVKFGVPLDQVCKHEDIPGPLLVLILKLNKEGPNKKDVFRAPGHQASMKKLVHFLHSGRLVNIDNFSVYTIASVLKKFLRKLPDGIFGRSGEEELFNMIQLQDTEQQRDLVHKLIVSRPKVTQHLLVLLFGTFRVIATNADRGNTGMTSEALGVSVAPSFFRSCVSHGKTASMDDVLRFKVATQIMKFMIDNFGVSNLFGRENYEYYARITGRILKVEEDWIFAFRYPPDTLVPRQCSLETEKIWLQSESDTWSLKFNLEAMSAQEESQSTPTLTHMPGAVAGPSKKRSDATDGGGASTSSSSESHHHPHSTTYHPYQLLHHPSIVLPESSLRESSTRLSISLEENGLYKGTTPSAGFLSGSPSSKSSCHHLTLEELRLVNHYAESTKSLSFLPQVHERQTERMKTRSEWFLTPQECIAAAERRAEASAMLHKSEMIQQTAAAALKEAQHKKHGSDESKLLRRSSSKDKERRLVRRSSSKKDKENGQKKRESFKVRSSSAEMKSGNGNGGGCGSVHPLQPFIPQNVNVDTMPRLMRQEVLSSRIGQSDRNISEKDCTETDMQTVHVSLTYKPRV